MNADEILERMSEGEIGVGLQTILVDVKRPEEEPEEICSFSTLGKASFRPELTVIQILIEMEDPDEYLALKKAVNEMELLLPQDERALAHVITLVPAQMEGTVLTYVSAYISTAAAMDERLTVAFAVHPDDIGFFELDTDRIPEDEAEHPAGSSEETETFGKGEPA